MAVPRRGDKVWAVMARRLHAGSRRHARPLVEKAEKTPEHQKSLDVRRMGGQMERREKGVKASYGSTSSLAVI